MDGPTVNMQNYVCQNMGWPTLLLSDLCRGCPILRGFRRMEIRAAHTASVTTACNPNRSRFRTGNGPESATDSFHCRRWGQVLKNRHVTSNPTEKAKMGECLRYGLVMPAFGGVRFTNASAIESRIEMAHWDRDCGGGAFAVQPEPWICRRIYENTLMV
jgi:hypothetical protein